jgi:hypothetical protein
VYWVGQNVIWKKLPELIKQINTLHDEGKPDEARSIMNQVWQVFNIRPDLMIEGTRTFVFDYEGFLGEVPICEQRMSIKSIIDMVGYDFDVIIHFQNWLNTTDEDKCEIPYIYYLTEPFYDVVPKSAHMVLTPAVSLTEQVKKKYGNQYKYGVLPWALRYGVHKIWKQLAPQNAFDVKNRPVDACFSGKMYNYDFYTPRREFVLGVEEKIPNFEGHWFGPVEDPYDMFGSKAYPERGKGALNLIDYTSMLTRSKFGINYPTDFGVNYRDFEVPASGAVLLTRKNPDHKILGLKDGVNCRIYKTVDEAVEIIKDGYDLDIALEGFNHTIQKHNYINRTRALLQAVEEVM